MGIVSIHESYKPQMTIFPLSYLVYIFTHSLCLANVPRWRHSQLYVSEITYIC